MKIVQVVDGYKKGDGVGNVVASLDEFLKRNNVETQICNRQLDYEDIESELFGKDIIVFYHLALLMDPVIQYLECKKVLIFHNITEPELLAGADDEKRMWCSAGLYDSSKTAEYFDLAITFSDYSKNCLIHMGWNEEKIFVLPILVRLNQFSMKPSKEIIGKYKDDSVNILFTGRVYPNKKQEDLIAAFAAYKRNYQKKAKLFLVGSIAPGNYYPSLLAYAEKLGVSEDIIFSGFVSFEEYLAYYHIADIYLCMSAHEGFCIPLVEAMYFELPILACPDTAVPDTLAGSGILLKSRNPEYVAGKINELVLDEEYRQKIIDEQNIRKKQLLPEQLEEQYLSKLKIILSKLEKEKRNLKDKVDNEYSFSLIHDLHVQIERRMKNSEKYVIYGAGAAGTRVFMALKRYVKEDKLVLCDSYKAGSFDRGLGCEIISPDQAVDKYRYGIFIISVQDKRLMIDIIISLLEKGIAKEHLLIYDKLSNQIL